MPNKTALIISREYLTRVKKKSFLLITILVPLIIIAFYAVIIMITLKGSTDRQRIAVIDEAGLLVADSAAKADGYEFISNESEPGFVKKYKSLGYDAFLYIPKFDLNNPNNFRLHSSASASLTLLSRAEKKLNRAIEGRRLKDQGISSETYDKIGADVDLENTIDTETGSKKSVAGIAYGVSFACGIMIYMMMIIYGTQVMRGVSEEKTNRIAEVIVSSVKPFQLMMGKIIGIGAVGLTQFAIWTILIICMQMAIPLIFPGIADQMNNASAGAAGNSAAAGLLEGFYSLPLLKIGLSFVFYFLGGYLTYASLFAAVGSMSTDDQQDTQQMIFPILMPIILGFVIMTKAISDPHSNLAVFGSLFPLTSPIVMMGRITYDVPAWQMLLSGALLIGCFIFLTWLTAKIYRTGILMYGKKPSWKEMFRWALKG